MKLVFEIDEKPFAIQLHKRSKHVFRVTYGYQVDDHLTYAEAAAKLGQAIMHRAACDGLLD